MALLGAKMLVKTRHFGVALVFKYLLNVCADPYDEGICRCCSNTQGDKCIRSSLIFHFDFYSFDMLFVFSSKDLKLGLPYRIMWFMKVFTLYNQLCWSFLCLCCRLSQLVTWSHHQFCGMKILAGSHLKMEGSYLTILILLFSSDPKNF